MRRVLSIFAFIVLMCPIFSPVFLFFPPVAFCTSFFGGGGELAAEDGGEQAMDEGGEGDGGAESRGPSPSLLFI